MNEVLAAWNGMAFEEAVGAVLPCNGSLAWAQRVAQGRPFASPEPLLAAADEAWRTLPEADWQQAFASHPRLGESEVANGAATAAQSLLWSRGEQSTLSGDAGERAALGAANRAYEARFGRVFLLCATGKDAAQILALLHGRLGNDLETEVREAAEQQRRITQLRLRKWLGLPAATCEHV